ncbi:MAG: murein biosynthesis integral membrane protein MurJ [Candidatus Nomurabacteria bacterium]|jgi:putative peptidoglycan lipid II flippase|nr:murein biosynthesis integral membrane protein MurJ [Candidatus Nomurabacteria bacterium]
MKFKLRSVVALANKKLPIKLAALVLAGSTLISALLGIFRDRLLNTLYLDTYPAGIDAYTVAFTVPDFMFFLLVSGALSVTFIPVFNKQLMSDRRKEAWRLSSSVLNIFAIATMVVSVLIMIFAEPLVKHVVGPGLSESSMALAVSMMRVVAINPFLFAISTVLASIQQAVGRFVFYAMAPAVYNIGIIIGITQFTGGITIFGVQIFEGGIMGVALGVVLGAILQLVISIVGVLGLGFDYEFKIDKKSASLKKVFGLLPARSIDQGIDYVNQLVEINMASRMGSGTVRSFQQASSLSLMPVNLIGTAVATAFFPKMTEDLGADNTGAFKRDFSDGLRTIIWLALPISLVAFATRGYVVNFIKNGGDQLIASLLGILVISIFCRCLFAILSRGFYASQDTRTPLLVSVAAIGLNIGLAVWFTLGLKIGPYGLAYAESIGAVVEITLLMVLLGRKFKNLFSLQFARTVIKIVFASAAAFVVAYFMTHQFQLAATDDSFGDTFPKFLLISLGSFLVYFLIGFVLKIPETRQMVGKIGKMLGRVVKKR